MLDTEEIVADSEEDEDFLIPAIPTVADTISEFSTITANDSVISNYSSVVPLQKPLPSTSTSRPKPRPIARPTAKMAAASSSSIDMVTPSIADTAKMRKRNSTIQPPTEIIELTDDEDELALRPSPKPKTKPPKKTKIQKQRKPNPLRLSSADPDPPLLSSSLPVPTIHGDSSQLPPSDPPQSTPFNDEFEMPPIVTLSNPASSSSTGIDMGPPPPPFYAPDSSSSLPRAAVPPSTPVINDSANLKPKGRKPKKINSDDEDFEPGMEAKEKGKGKKAAKGRDKAQVKKAKKKTTTTKKTATATAAATTDFKSTEFVHSGDEGDMGMNDNHQSTLPHAESHHITSPPRPRPPSPSLFSSPPPCQHDSPGNKRYIDDEDPDGKDVEGGARKRMRMSMTNVEAEPEVIPDRNNMDIDLDFDDLISAQTSSKIQSTSTSSSRKGSKRRVVVYSDDEGGDGEVEVAALGGGREANGHAKGKEGEKALVDMARLDNTTTTITAASASTPSTTTSPIKAPSKPKPKPKPKVATKGKKIDDVPTAKSKPKAKGAKAKKGRDVADEEVLATSSSSASRVGIVEDIDIDMEVGNDDDDGVRLDSNSRDSVKENISPSRPPLKSVPQTPIGTTPAIAAPSPVPTSTPAQLKYPSLTSRYTIAPKSSRQSTPMSELIRRVNSMPNSQFKSPVPVSRRGLGSSASGSGTSTGSTSSNINGTESISSPSSGLTAYSPYLKSSRSFLSRIAPLHPNRRPPPSAPPPPPPRRKTKKEIEWEKMDKDEREEIEERWEEEVIASVGGSGEWEMLGEERRKMMKRMKRDRELGVGGWEE